VAERVIYTLYVLIDGGSTLVPYRRGNECLLDWKQCPY